MKRLTVAAAALAAGMLTIVAQSQAESDRNMFHKPVAKVAAADARRQKPDAKDIAGKEREANRQPGEEPRPSRPARRSQQGEGPRRRAGLAIRPREDCVDRPRARPNLKAIARKSVKGFDSSLARREYGESVASAAGYTTLVSRYAAAYGVPVSLAHAVISVESNYRPNTRGSAGEIGLMQIKPATARMMGYTGHASGLFNPETNIKYGMKYLGMAHQLSGGATCGTILRYNAGHGARRMNPVSAAYCSKVKLRLVGGLNLEGRAISVAFFATNAFIATASRPGGRTRDSRKAAGEESPGSMETRCRITSGGGDPRESATESKPPAFAFGRRRGKGERVG